MRKFFSLYLLFFFSISMVMGQSSQVPALGVTKEIRNPFVVIPSLKGEKLKTRNPNIADFQTLSPNQLFSQYPIMPRFSPNYGLPIRPYAHWGFICKWEADLEKRGLPINFGFE